MNQYEHNTDEDRSVSSLEMSSKKFQCPECPKDFSSRYSRDCHVSKFHESEESDMNSDDSASSDENSSNDEISSDNVKSSSDMTDNDEGEMEEESVNDDTNPFDDFIYISYKRHLEERRANRAGSRRRQ